MNLQITVYVMPFLTFLLCNLCQCLESRACPHRVLGFRSYQTKSALNNGASRQIQQEELLF